MGRRASFRRAPVVLVANAFGTWLSQALSNLVAARGYRVHFVLSGREVLDQAPALRPDVIVLDADLPDIDSITVCRTLREDRAAWNMPVMMITATPATKQQRLAALKAGAWDYLSVLLNPEEVTLKIDAMSRLKLEMERALEQSALDPASGLYTLPGLERRARELTSDAMRRHAPLACVALGIGLDPKGAGESAAALSGAAAYAGQVLQASGRDRGPPACPSCGCTRGTTPWRTPTAHPSNPQACSNTRARRCIRPERERASGFRPTGRRLPAWVGNNWCNASSRHGWTFRSPMPACRMRS